MSNPQGKPKGPYAPGWTTAVVLKPYYADTKKYVSHVPYTTDLDGFRMNQRDVLMHSFELTEANMLPAPMLRAIAKHPYVWWDPEQGDHAQREGARKRTKRGVDDKERQETMVLPLHTTDAS